MTPFGFWLPPVRRSPSLDSTIGNTIDWVKCLSTPTRSATSIKQQGVTDKNILGMVGLKHLRGVMILSKPSLLAGFDIPSSKDNVGIHEFTHLVEHRGDRTRPAARDSLASS